MASEVDRATRMKAAKRRRESESKRIDEIMESCDKVVQILKPLDNEARGRVLGSAIDVLGITTRR